MIDTLMDSFPQQGCPRDRGSADAYYQRPFDPHWYPNGTGKGIKITQVDMTSEEVAEYTEAYNNETDRKDWG